LEFSGGFADRTVGVEKNSRLIARTAVPQSIEVLRIAQASLNGQRSQVWAVVKFEIDASGKCLCVFYRAGRVGRVGSGAIGILKIKFTLTPRFGWLLDAALPAPRATVVDGLF